jgi:hypothetical protein
MKSPPSTGATEIVDNEMFSLRPPLKERRLPNNNMRMVPTPPTVLVNHQTGQQIFPTTDNLNLMSILKHEGGKSSKKRKTKKRRKTRTCKSKK